MVTQTSKRLSYLMAGMSRWACRMTRRGRQDSNVERYLNRAFSSPYNNSETLDDSEDTDENADVYKPEEQVQDQEYVPVVEEEPRVHVPEPEAPVSAPVEVSPGVRTSGRVRSKPELYSFPPKVLHITVRKGLAV